MTIDPISQLSLYLAAFLGGMGMGLLAELGKIVRILLGAYQPPVSFQARYERPLPWISRSIGWRRAPARRAWVLLVSFLCDFFFPVLAALYLLYILFRFNSGIFRISAPLLLLVGLGLWRTAFSKSLSGVFSLLAFALAVLWLYMKTLLLLPPRLLWYMLSKFVLLPLRRLFLACAQRLSLWRSRALCRGQLNAAKRGFQPSAKQTPKKRKGTKKICRKTGKRAVASHPLP